MNEKLTRKLALQILDRSTDKKGFDDWWPDLMDSLGLYDEDTDDFPTFYDVMEALGVSKKECDDVGI